MAASAVSPYSTLRTFEHKERHQAWAMTVPLMTIYGICWKTMMQSSTATITSTINDRDSRVATQWRKFNSRLFFYRNVEKMLAAGHQLQCSGVNWTWIPLSILQAALSFVNRNSDRPPKASGRYLWATRDRQIFRDNGSESCLCGPSGAASGFFLETGRIWSAFAEHFRAVRNEARWPPHFIRYCGRWVWAVPDESPFTCYHWRVNFCLPAMSIVNWQPVCLALWRTDN